MDSLASLHLQKMLLYTLNISSKPLRVRPIEVESSFPLVASRRSVFGGFGADPTIKSSQKPHSLQTAVFAANIICCQLLHAASLLIRQAWGNLVIDRLSLVLGET